MIIPTRPGASFFCKTAAKRTEVIAMTWDKDIRFPDKKVDSDWKSTLESKVPVSPDRKTEEAAPTAKTSEKQPAGTKRTQTPTSKDFLNLVSSLGYQALMQLGEIPDPTGQLSEPNLEGAREVINLLIALKQKTTGNLSDQEEEMLTHLLADLQMKYAGRT